LSVPDALSDHRVDLLTLIQLRSLEDSLAASEGRDIVGFVDNGMKSGEVSTVIESLSQQVRAAGKTVKLYDDSWDLALECRTDEKGLTPCYGAVVFFSSPNEGSTLAPKGYWNYTIREGGGSGSIDVRTTNSGAERVVLPLQRAVDAEIISQSKVANKTQPSDGLQVIGFTDQDQDALTNDRTDTYLSLSIYVFGPLFPLTLIQLVYHMTSFVSRERELGT
jgi:hypothetical protein